MKYELQKDFFLFWQFSLRKRPSILIHSLISLWCRFLRWMTRNEWKLLYVIGTLASPGKNLMLFKEARNYFITEFEWIKFFFFFSYFICHLITIEIRFAWRVAALCLFIFHASACLIFLSLSFFSSTLMALLLNFMLPVLTVVLLCVCEWVYFRGNEKSLFVNKKIYLLRFFNKCIYGKYFSLLWYIVDAAARTLLWFSLWMWK